MQGAASVSEGLWVYQLTDKGLALEITAKRTKYSKDDDGDMTGSYRQPVAGFHASGLANSLQ